jgi:hypothetical protein
VVLARSATRVANPDQLTQPIAFIQNLSGSRSFTGRQSLREPTYAMSMRLPSWLRLRIDPPKWPRSCPDCGGTLATRALITTARPSDGARRPGVGLKCRRCQAEYDWLDIDGYRLRKKPTE